MLRIMMRSVLQEGDLPLFRKVHAATPPQAQNESEEKEMEDASAVAPEEASATVREQDKETAMEEDKPNADAITPAITPRYDEGLGQSALSTGSVVGIVCGAALAAVLLTVASVWAYRALAAKRRRDATGLPRDSYDMPILPVRVTEGASAPVPARGARGTFAY